MALTIRQLREACAPFEAAVGHEGRASADALARARPGGADNPTRDARAWLRYYGRLRAWHGGGSLGDAGGTGAAESGRGASVATGATAADAFRTAVRQAGAGEPEPVRCADGVVRYVHPKSAYALRWLDSLDAQLAGQAGRAAASVRALAAGEATAEDLRVLALRPLAEALAVRLWLWVLTRPGAELPFADDAPDPVPPAWTGAAMPEDLVAVWHAHRRVNHERSAIMAAAFPPDPAATPSRLSLEGFLAHRSQELGVRPSTLDRQWSLGELYAQAVSAAVVAREAHAAAKATAARDAAA